MKKILFLMVTSLSLQLGISQPNWEVTANDFQFSMTVTSEALIDCQSIIETNDLLAAFVDDSCRGVINFGTEVAGNKLAYLIVYSNVSAGETVQFKLYDESEDLIIDVLDVLPFTENAIFGDANHPQLMTNNHPPTALILDSTTLTDVSTAGETVAFFSTEDIDMDVYTYSLSNDTTTDNSAFTFQNNELVMNNDANIVAQSEYFIEVIAIDASGCSITDTFTIAINNTNDAPTDIYFTADDDTVNENESIGSLVGLFEVTDVTNPDSHTYTLAANVMDNDHFSINNNELLTATVFDYEIRNEYDISVTVTDAAGNSFIKEMIVNIKDVIEFDDLKANNVITPNGDGFNDFFAIPNNELFANYEFTVFNENGNKIFRRSPSAGYNNLWDGTTTEGNELPSGNYYFLLQEINSENQFTGIITLLRD